VKRAKEAKDSTKKQPKKKKKGNLTPSLKPKASLNPKQKIPPKKPIPTNFQNEISRHGCYSETMEDTASSRMSGQESGHGLV
jgi:hypothetical protein